MSYDLLQNDTANYFTYPIIFGNLCASMKFFRLKRIGKHLSSTSQETTPTTYSSLFKTWSPPAEEGARRQLSVSEPDLKLEFDATISKIGFYVKLLSFEKNTERLKKIREKLKNLGIKANKLGLSLHYIYQKLHGDKESASNIGRHLHACLPFVTGAGFPHDAESPFKAQTSFSNILRRLTRQTNFWRLFLIRLKRFFDVMTPLVKSIQIYQELIKNIDLVNPILSYVAWVFYVPRLLTNSYLLLRNTLPGDWMTHEQKELGWLYRLKAEWAKRWSELLNDSVWAGVGLINCFILSGPQAMLLTVGLYSFDVAMALMNRHYQLSKHARLLEKVKEQEKSYTDILSQIRRKEITDISEEKIKHSIESLQSYQDSLNEWIVFEEAEVRLSLQVSAGLMFGMGLSALPLIFSLGSYLSLGLPPLAALCVLGVCVGQYIKSQQVEQLKPKMGIEQLGNISALWHTEREESLEPSDGKDKKVSKQEPKDVNPLSPEGASHSFATARGRMFSTSPSLGKSHRLAKKEEDGIELCASLGID